MGAAKALGNYTPGCPLALAKLPESCHHSGTQAVCGKQSTEMCKILPMGELLSSVLTKLVKQEKTRGALSRS